MRLLSKLSPAETLLLKHGDVVLLKELLKYTFMDLLLNQVLAISEVEKAPSHREPVRIYKYVTTGKNFKGYVSKPHEVVFTDAFKDFPDYSILFRNLVRIAYQNAKSQRKYFRSLRRNEHISDAFSTNLVTFLSGGLNYTAIGSRLKTEVTSELREVERIINECIKTDRRRVVETFRTIRGNALLIDGFDFALMREFEKELAVDETWHSPTDPWSGPIWVDGVILDSIGDSNSSEWNDPSETHSSWDADGGDGNDGSDSSDSGDSGGDGGCSSGCGGCGGD